jgi:hypothetical protein
MRGPVLGSQDLALLFLVESDVVEVVRRLVAPRDDLVRLGFRHRCEPVHRSEHRESPHHVALHACLAERLN